MWHEYIWSSLLFDTFIFLYNSLKMTILFHETALTPMLWSYALSICLDEIIFVQEKIFCLYKKFFPRLKISYLFREKDRNGTFLQALFTWSVRKIFSSIIRVFSWVSRLKNMESRMFLARGRRPRAEIIRDSMFFNRDTQGKLSNFTRTDFPTH